MWNPVFLDPRHGHSCGQHIWRRGAGVEHDQRVDRTRRRRAVGAGAGPVYPVRKPVGCNRGVLYLVTGHGDRPLKQASLEVTVPDGLSLGLPFMAGADWPMELELVFSFDVTLPRFVFHFSAPCCCCSRSGPARARCLCPSILSLLLLRVLLLLKLTSSSSSLSLLCPSTPSLASRPLPPSPPSLPLQSSSCNPQCFLVLQFLRVSTYILDTSPWIPSTGTFQFFLLSLSITTTSPLSLSPSSLGSSSFLRRGIPKTMLKLSGSHRASSIFPDCSCEPNTTPASHNELSRGCLHTQEHTTLPLASGLSKWTSGASSKTQLLPQASFPAPSLSCPIVQGAEFSPPTLLRVNCESF